VNLHDKVVFNHACHCNKCILTTVIALKSP